MSVSSKSFENLESDYKFFESVVSEKEGVLAIWEPVFQELRQRSSLRVLDFGCGSGGFTQEILEELSLPPEQVELSLVEPAPNPREQARERFRKLPLKCANVVPTLDELGSGPFDLILSHHVFYYVPELNEVLQGLRQRLDAQGWFLSSLTGENSGPGQLQESALALGGLSSPYRTGPDCKGAVVEVFPDARVENFTMHLDMADTASNRASIMRFLVGEFREKLPWAEVLQLFDSFSDGERIVVPSEEFCVIVGPAG